MVVTSCITWVLRFFFFFLLFVVVVVIFVSLSFLFLFRWEWTTRKLPTESNNLYHCKTTGSEKGTENVDGCYHPVSMLVPSQELNSSPTAYSVQWFCSRTFSLVVFLDQYMSRIGSIVRSRGLTRPSVQYSWPRVNSFEHSLLILKTSLLLPLPLGPCTYTERTEKTPYHPLSTWTPNTTNTTLSTPTFSIVPTTNFPYTVYIPIPQIYHHSYCKF